MIDPGCAAGLAPAAAALLRAGSGSTCFVAGAVAQHALLPAAVRGSVAPELTKPGVDALASINKYLRVLF